MRWTHRLVPLVLAWSFAGSVLAAATTSVRLVLPVDTVKPGDSFMAGVELTMKPGWHTYWRYGGDSGAPTTIDWTLPPGLTAGDIRWPAPEKLSEKGLTTYIYHGTVMLLVPFTVGADATPGPLDLAATVKWLECEKECVPRRGPVQGRLTIGAETRPSENASLVRTAEQKLPPKADPGSASATWDSPAQGEERALLIRWRPPEGTGTPDFYGDSGEGYEVQTAVDRFPDEAGEIILRKKVRKLEGGAWPSQVEGLLVLANARNLPLVAREAVLPIADPTAAIPPPANSATSSAAGDVPAPAFSLPSLTLGKALLLGLIGGMILNIMPCVLPVIALKILGFVRQSGNRPAEARKLGLVYALGVWISFMVLAVVVIAVKKTAGIAGWGMQFGNPVFLVVMTTLILLVALSLFGVFEINLTGRALDSAGDLTRKEGPAGSFFNGMLAVALATPCTAPFLAPALGYAFTADSTTILLVFTAVAVGLALPYVVLSWQPAWLKFLPKPGAWMERFKVAMGFPMLATAVWLYTLAADRFGEPGALWLGVFLVGIGLAAWVWGEFVQRGRTRQALAMAISILLAGIAYVLTLERELHWRSPIEKAAPASMADVRRSDGIPWQPWSREAVQAARKEGRPVFVDFTADWCWTCKFNERTSINIPVVRKQLESIDAVALKGDYTDIPPAITEELQRFGRAGVPLVVVYPKAAAKEPIVLPAFLTPDLVLDALKQAVL